MPTRRKHISSWCWGGGSEINVTDKYTVLVLRRRSSSSSSSSHIGCDTQVHSRCLASSFLLLLLVVTNWLWDNNTLIAFPLPHSTGAIPPPRQRHPPPHYREHTERQPACNKPLTMTVPPPSSREQRPMQRSPSDDNNDSNDSHWADLRPV